MQTIRSNAGGLRLLLRLQADLILALMAVGLALMAGAWLQTTGLN